MPKYDFFVKMALKIIQIDLIFLFLSSFDIFWEYIDSYVKLLLEKLFESVNLNIRVAIFIQIKFVPYSYENDILKESRAINEVANPFFNILPYLNFIDFDCKKFEKLIYLNPLVGGY